MGVNHRKNISPSVVVKDADSMPNTVNDGGQPKSNAAVAPIDGDSWLSNLFLLWVGRLAKTGYKRPLEMSDIPPLAKADNPLQLYNAFMRNWEGESQKPKPSIWRAVK